MVIGIDVSRTERDKLTGTEWYCYHIIEHLKKLPTEHQFILYSRDKLMGELGHLPSNFTNKPLKWIFNLLWTQLRLSWEVLFNPPDMLFVPAHTIPIFRHCPAVVTIHDVGFDANPELYSWVDKLYHRFSVWYASTFAYKIIVPSEFTKKELIKYYRTNPDKISVVYHGSPEKVTSYKLQVSRLRQFVFIGRLEKKKNILNILRAFRQVLDKFPEVRLVLAGSQGHGFAEFADYIADNELEDRVQLPGYITEKEKEILYRESIGFLFPTLYEGFGLPILEAQAHNCPVITSNIGANAEVAGEEALLVDPRKPEEIAGAMVKILVDESERTRLVTAGQNNLQRFSWEKAAEKTLQLFS